MAPFETARWVSADDPADLKAFTDLNRAAMAKDRDGNPVFMAKTEWEVGYVADRYPKVRFAATREREESRRHSVTPDWFRAPKRLTRYLERKSVVEGKSVTVR